MGMDAVVTLGRQTLETALWVGAPLLVIVTIVSLLINVGQVLTSLQDVTISTVPRLMVVAVTLFLLMPWMLRRLMTFTLHLLSDFRPLVNWMLDLAQMIEAAVLVGTRVSALMVFTPFPGGSAVPVQVKAGLTVAITALLLPLYGRRMAAASLTTIASELCIGALLGLTVTFIFEGAQLAGQYAGFQVGFSLVNIIDPQTQVETPVLGTLHQVLVLLLFLQLNVHHWLLRGIARSFEYLPQASFNPNGRVVEHLFQAAGGMFLAGIQIAAPILLATMTADLALGFVAKASPQMQVLFLGFPIKTVLALVVWIGALSFWPSKFEGYFAQVIGSGEKLLRLAR